MLDLLKKLVEDATTPKQMSNDFKQVFSGDTGEKVLKEILKRCKVTSSTFNQEPHISSYNQGARDVGLFILKLVESKKHIEDKNDRRNQ